MAPGGCLLLALLLLAGTAQGQHWSHGWYPGGKRDLSAPQVPAALRPCPTPPCRPLPPMPSTLRAALWRPLEAALRQPH
uniref:Progonadoliberin n=1 Tax=Gallus gallus TaxID=9031 RepID=Q2ACD7_CHICK|nr:chicken-II-type gonadotropin-releasing hormone and full mitochondrial ribosomal protein S26 polycistronic type [Gallus gallus]